MNNLVQSLAFGASAVLLGLAMVLGVLFALIARRGINGVEMCLGTLIVLYPLGLSAYFFALSQ
jgi:hypothetical protein